MRSGRKESRSTNSVEITTREAGRSPRSTRSRICVAVAHTVSTLVSMLVNSGVVHWENRELFSPTMGMLISLACSAFVRLLPKYHQPQSAHRTQYRHPAFLDHFARGLQFVLCLRDLQDQLPIIRQSALRQALPVSLNF